MCQVLIIQCTSETAAPLSTVFQNRSVELKTLIEGIRCNKVVIVHGPAGVGKTRLVLEATRTIAKEDGYKLLCVKNNNLQLYDDLIANTDRPGNYLFFIDDANELAGLNLILGYITKADQGYQIKVIMTVRDYAKESVVCETIKHVTPYLYELSAFSDEAIKDFLNVNMQIVNDQFVDIIIKIAEGNPRIAYMAGKLAKETQSLAAVHDATQVYEQYYASIIQTKLGDNRNLCLTAGIIALVKTILLERLDNLEQVLKIGNISKEEFLECIRKLSSMEVVEIHRDKVATISDQCFANYMLYYEFFSQKRILFSEILSIGFVHFRGGVIQSINTLLNLFAKDDLHNYIEEEVIKTWERFQKDNSDCFEDFARIFHIFRPEEAFIIAGEKIEKIPHEAVLDRHIDFEKGSFKSGEEILGFLTGFRYSDHLETVIELLMEYVQKSEENAIIGYSWLKNNCGVSLDSCLYDYHAEYIIAKKLFEYANGTHIAQRVILAYASYALSFEFQSTEAGRGNTFKMYTIHLANSNGVKKYRAECWSIVKILSSNPYLQEDVLSYMQKYAMSVRGAEDKDIVLDDKSFVMEIVFNLKCSSLKKALIIRDLQYGWKKCGISYEKDNSLFHSHEWELYKLLEDKWIDSELEYQDYEKQREGRLKSYADRLDKALLSEFVKSVASITESMSAREKYSVVNGAEVVIRRLCENPETAWLVFKAVLDDGTDIGLCPDIILQPLFAIRSCKEIWETLNKYDYRSKNVWDLSFFQMLPEELADTYTYGLLIEFLNSDSDKEIQSSPHRRLRFLDKFADLYQDIYVTATRIIFDKRAYSPFIVCMYFVDLFNESLFLPEELISKFSSDTGLLKEIFFFTLKNDEFADYKGRFLVKFLSFDESWIDAYAEMIYEKTQDARNYDCNQYTALWQSDDYMKYFDRIFEKFACNYNDIYSWRYAEVFKAMLSYKENNQIVPERQEKWILHIIGMYAKDKRIICLFYALSETRVSLRSRAFQEFFRLNNDYDMFENIQLDSNYWGGSMEEIIPDLQKRIDFLDALLPYVKGVKYLRHARRIRSRIDYWKAQIEQEEIEAIYRNIFK